MESMPIHTRTLYTSSEVTALPGLVEPSGNENETDLGFVGAAVGDVGPHVDVRSVRVARCGCVPSSHVFLVRLVRLAPVPVELYRPVPVRHQMVQAPRRSL